MLGEIVGPIACMSGISFSNHNTLGRETTSKNELQVVLVFVETTDSL